MPDSAGLRAFVARCAQRLQPWTQLLEDALHDRARL